MRRWLGLGCMLFLLLVLNIHADSAPLENSSSEEEGLEEEPLEVDIALANNVSSHVLDIAMGRPAVGVVCIAYKWVPGREMKANGKLAAINAGHWELWGQTKTDVLGRIPIVHPGQPLKKGQFKLHFRTKEYFERQQPGQPTFYPFVEVIFQVDDPNVHYHVPITLSNFGYSTYRGQ